MNRELIINEILKYFSVKEFVSKDVYDLYKDDSIKFIDSNLLEALLLIRKNINKPIIINNWHLGGEFSQRGLRTNISPLTIKRNVKSMLYLSSHVFGKAFDFDIKGISAKDVRKWIIDNNKLFNFKIRLEKTSAGKEINWVHLDTISESKNDKIYLFNA